MSRAILIQANLRGSRLLETYLGGADLGGANLSGANLGRADLFEAYMRRADLSEANLSEANLTRADLSEANLSGAGLSGVKGVTGEQLKQQAGSLEGATMPNGQKYEDWLKSRGEDGENSGPS